MTPPPWVTNEESWRKNCRRVVARAGDLLEGRVSLVAAAYHLEKLRFWLRAQNDRDFDIFTAITSETTHLPVGRERQHWAKDALEAKDVEIRRIEDFYRANALDAARKLQMKYFAKA